MQNAETTMKAARMPARNTLALALAAALSLAPMAGTAATLTVTSNADPGTTTTCTLRQAIVTVNNGTAAGSNEGNCRANSVGSFGNDTITFDTSAFPTNGSGSITLSGSRLDITANDLSIDGSANGQVTIDANSASSVISDSAAAGSSLKLSHLTLSNGLGNSISCVTHAGGGAVCSPYADLTLTNSTLSGNSSDYGGGIYSVSGNITLTNSTCTGNQAIHNGGCIYSRSGNIKLNGSDVSGNDSGKYGGGINAVNGSITANNITINSNKAYTGGGGIAAQNGTVAVTDSTIGQNKAAGGGAIFSKGSITLARDTLLGNTSSGNGAGIFSAGSVALISSTVSGNSATESGGGIYGYKADLALTNSTLSGNSAKSGGGILAHDGSVTLSNATISGNSASVLFGGIDFYAGTLLANNAIVSGNNAGDSRFGSVSGSHNLIGNVANLNLGSLADNGGPTQTMLPQVGSAAIDAGDDSSCTGTGQRSFARPQGAHCDIGAVEVEQLPLIVSVTAGGAVSASATPAAQSGGITHCTSAGGVNCHAYFLGDGSVSTATLTATFDAGHYFSGWSGACVAAGSSASATVSMNQGRQCTASFASVSLSASGNPAPSTWGQTIVLSASWSGAGTGDGDSITFSEGSTLLCSATLSGGSASCNAPALTAGSHTLTAHFAGDSLNGETSVDFAQQVNQATQTITNFAANPPNPTYSNGGSFTVSANGGGSGNPVTFASGSPAVCTVSGQTVSMLSVGTCSLTANQAGDSNYTAAPQVTLNVPIGQGSQTISFASPGTQTLDQHALALNPTASSGLPVTLVSTTPGVCSVTGSGPFTVSFNTLGTCSLTASQAGNANFAAAPDVTVSFAIDAPAYKPVPATSWLGRLVLSMLLAGGALFGLRRRV